MKYFILKWSSEKKQNNKTKRSLWCRLLHKMIVPLSANPDFDDKIEDVTLWFIEYDDVVNHIANREIGFAPSRTFWAASFTLWMRRARKSSMLHTMRGGKQTETLNTIGPALWLHGA